MRSAREARSAGGMAARKTGLGLPSFSRSAAPLPRSTRSAVKPVRTTKSSISVIWRFSILRRSATGRPAMPVASVMVVINATSPAATSSTNKRYLPLAEALRQKPSPGSRRWPFSVFLSMRRKREALGIVRDQRVHILIGEGFKTGAVTGRGFGLREGGGGQRERRE